MRLVYHGGQCCGIKIIKDFPWLTTDSIKTELTCAVKRKEVTNKDKYGNTVSSNDDFFTDEAPKETYPERLDRLINFVRVNRPKHIIEAVLADGRYSNQSYLWGPILEERGFKKVTSALNSNSGNTCHIYHLVVNDVEDAKKKEKELSA